MLKNASTYFRKNHIGKNLVIITDTTVARFYLPALKKNLIAQKFSVHSIILPPGEDQKSIATVEMIFTQLLQWNIERTTTIVALGGGVIGDLAGFVAATYQRGIGFVQIPTTLLAQVDSSVGGKVGINHSLAKNMIGAFHQPLFVLADTAVLKTLPKRERICGIGEIVKYGVILDREFFEFLERSLEGALSGDNKILMYIIRRCCELKSFVVSNDEKEENLRAILNFGHTVGHALEHAGKYSFLKHGEAILYGMIAESQIAFEMNMISFAEKERIERMIQRIPIPFLTPMKLKLPDLIAAMKKDKKVKNGLIRMTLPTKIGTVTLPMNVTERIVQRSIRYVKIYGA